MKRRGARLTHLDARGAARMVDVGAKPATAREAVAEGFIGMNATAFRAIDRGAVAKGDVFALARAAGIAAAKRTAELVPLCHVVPLDQVAVRLDRDRRRRRVRVEATARAHSNTGVEMEALVAVSAALLTIYDMTKALDRGMVVSGVRLLRKSGGRSGLYERGSRGRAGGGPVSGGRRRP